MSRNRPQRSNISRVSYEEPPQLIFDVLGACCALVPRFLTEDGPAFVVVRTENAEMLATSLTEVGRVAVVTTVESVRDCAPRLRRVKEFSTVEKSTRFDSVASAGFGVSRTTMADRIKSGALQVNRKTVRTPATNVNVTFMNIFFLTRTSTTNHSCSVC